MSSDHQVAANRLNAQRSTGPRTPAGKTRVSMNATKHGFTARDVVLPGEDPADFEHFRAGILASLDPHGALENFFAEKIADDAWRLTRVRRFEAALYRRGCEELLVKQAEELVAQYESTAKDRLFASLEKKEVAASDRQAHEDAQQRLARERAKLDDPAFNVALVLKTSPEPFLNLWRHDAQLSRSLLRNMHELERLQARRAGQHVPVPAVVDVDVNVPAPAGADIEETGPNKKSDGDPK